MENKQLLKTIEHEMIVTAEDEGMTKTVGSIFQKMRKQIFNEISQPIIQMEAKEVYFDKVEIKEKKEAFLFVLWPRVRKYYAVTARIIVTVQYLDLEKEDN